MGKRKPDAPGEDLYEERIKETIICYKKAWVIYEEAEDSSQEPSIRSIAYRFNLSRQTLTRRINGTTISREFAYYYWQRLDLFEEKTLVD